MAGGGDLLGGAGEGDAVDGEDDVALPHHPCAGAARPHLRMHGAAFTPVLHLIYTCLTPVPPRTRTVGPHLRPHGAAFTPGQHLVYTWLTPVLHLYRPRTKDGRAAPAARLDEVAQLETLHRIARELQLPPHGGRKR